MRGYTRRTHSPVKVTIQVIVPKGTLPDSNKLRKEFPYMMNGIREDAMEYWDTLAGQTLNRSRRRYTDAMSSRATSKDNFVLELKGRAAVMIEEGYDPFDMTEGFAASNKLKTGRMKIPKDKRSEIESKPKVPFKWMIIPIDTKGGMLFRTFTTNHVGTGKWWNTGYDGAHLMDKVNDHIVDDLIEKHVDELLRKIL